MHKSLGKPPRKKIGISDKHTRGYVENFLEPLMRKKSVQIEHKIYRISWLVSIHKWSF